jgi:DNA polymerase-3 subunit alpha
MRIVYFDTETTGLPKTRESALKGPDNWPHLVSIAWVSVDTYGSRHERYYIIKPQWEIPADSTKIHGITQEFAEKTGSELKYVLEQFLAEKPMVLVAHNANFDSNVLMNAILWDAKMPYPTMPPFFCTMEASRSICKIPVSYSKVKYKSPKLSELYEKVFGKKPEGTLHNSLYDVKILVEIVEATPLLRSMIGLPDAHPINIDNASPAKRSKILHL